MGDVSEHIPVDAQTVAAIYAYHKHRGDSESPRGYLGASIIGHECERYLWYTFRFCCRPEFEGRMYRLFETGDLAEVRFVGELRAIGCEVHDVDQNGSQFEVTALGDHFSGHMDGCALGLPEAPKTWHVLEFKTHNNKSFTRLKQGGVEKSKPQHYAQMQAYMHLTGMRRALYLATNKDTDELYAERVRYDKEFCEALMARALRVITSTSPPGRITDRPDYWKCRFCDARAICWPTGTPALPVPAINCRQCCHATPTMDGYAHWRCEKHGRGLSAEDQRKTCDDHLVLPGLIGFAEPLDYNDGCIVFNGEAGQWKHGTGGYSTRELTALPVHALFNPLVDTAKEVFGATATAFCGDDILDRYPEADSRLIWKGRASRLAKEWAAAYGRDLESETPLTKCDAGDYRAAEYSDGRVAIFYPLTREAEIRQGVE